MSLSKKPVIGIVLDYIEHSQKYNYSEKPWYALRADYSAMVIKYGGIPILLPYMQDIKEQLQLIDGLIIPGCDADINPKFYGQEIQSEFVTLNDKRTEYELKLAEAALKEDMPVFGICNGLQIINVLFGGTLIQHIPTTHPSQINHEQPTPKYVPTHDILIQENSLLASLAERLKLRVNTTHHQAIDQLANGLIVSAKAPDGIIEAIEAKNYRFLVGVQWHAEYENTLLDGNLFKKLISESSNRNKAK